MREGWRQQLGLIRGSGYDAADGGRLNKNWRATNEAADITDRYSRDTLRARARDLERNSDIANGVLKAFKRNVVGNGFTLQAKTGDDDLDDQIETLWRRWTRRTNCDVTQQQSFNELLRMAVVRKKADGGILFKKCYTPRRPTSFQAAGSGSRRTIPLCGLAQVQGRSRHWRH